MITKNLKSMTGGVQSRVMQNSGSFIPQKGVAFVSNETPLQGQELTMRPHQNNDLETRNQNLTSDLIHFTGHEE